MKQLNHCGQKKNRKESLPEPKEQTQLGSPAEIEIPAKTSHDRNRSVALPPAVSSQTKTRSESASGTPKFMPDPKFMDHGQSHPEDIDMYSTRS